MTITTISLHCILFNSGHFKRFQLNDLFSQLIYGPVYNHKKGFLCLILLPPIPITRHFRVSLNFKTAEVLINVQVSLLASILN